MLELELVSAGTVVNAKGDGPAHDVSAAAKRVFLLTLSITEIVEQESLDVSIFGSPDGATWGAKPVLSFPQKFYRGQHPLLLDLSAHPDIKFLRAHWDVHRWGRGAETPQFQFQLTAKEVPPEILKQAAAETHGAA
jgi:hypothetical protein